MLPQALAAPENAPMRHSCKLTGTAAFLADGARADGMSFEDICCNRSGAEREAEDRREQSNLPVAEQMSARRD